MDATTKAQREWDQLQSVTAALKGEAERCPRCNVAGDFEGIFGARRLSCPTCNSTGWLAPASDGAAPSDGPSGPDEKNQ